MFRKLSLVVAVAAMAALVTTSASAQSSTDKAAVPLPELHLIASTGTPAGGSVGAEDPLAQGPVENPKEAAESPGNACRGTSTDDSKTFLNGSGKHNSDGFCSQEELQAGGCMLNQDFFNNCGESTPPIVFGGITLPITDETGVVPTIVDGNDVCDTEASGKNYFGFNESDLGGCLDAAPVEEGGEYWTLRTTYLDGLGGKDLWMQVHLQCGNFTHISHSSPNSELQRNAASAMVRVRVKVTDTDSDLVRYALPDGRDGSPPLTGTFYEGDGSGAVYCRRSQTLMTKLQAIIDYGNDPAHDVAGFNDCLDPDTGILDPDPVCLSAEEVTVIVDQLQANTFSFLLPSVSSANQRIDVEAWLDTDSFAQSGEATAAATIGLGSMIVQTPRIVPDGEGTVGNPISLN